MPESSRFLDKRDFRHDISFPIFFNKLSFNLYWPGKNVIINNHNWTCSNWPLYECVIISEYTIIYLKLSFLRKQESTVSMSLMDTRFRGYDSLVRSILVKLMHNENWGENWKFSVNCARKSAWLSRAKAVNAVWESISTVCCEPLFTDTRARSTLTRWRKSPSFIFCREAPSSRLRP